MRPLPCMSSAAPASTSTATRLPTVTSWLLCRRRLPPSIHARPLSCPAPNDALLQPPARSMRVPSAMATLARPSRSSAVGRPSTSSRLPACSWPPTIRMSPATFTVLPIRLSAPPACSASGASTATLPALARSMEPHCCALTSPASSQTVLRRSLTIGDCSDTPAVAVPVVAPRTCTSESNTPLRPWAS
ncbi:hypothetical protein D3C71_631070 [compost metagenome]